MAQQQNDSLNQMPTSENSYMNDVTGKSYPQNGNNLDPTKNVSNMNEPQKGKPSGPNGNSSAGGPVGMPPSHNDASGMHLGPYGHPMQHHHMPPEIDQQQQPLEHMYNPQAPQYGRYHDPNMPPMDMYGRYHPGGLEMKMPPNRPPPQRYPQQQPQTSAVTQQQQQAYSGHPSHAPHASEQTQQEQSQQPPNPIGQTPTLNSLLQSHQTSGPPQPHHHRYPNSYEQQSGQQPSYGAQNWNPSTGPQQRPYSPQMGQQAYRPPPPNTNAARIHPSMSSYPPPPPQQNQTAQMGPAGAMQYSPYPQRYPTPPGSVATGANHRPAYPASHQYPADQSRPWPPPTGPTAQTQHGHVPHQHPPSPQHHVTAQSPVHAPSPSPQPPQPSNSPHQEICQNSNDSNTPGATTNTPNSMAMRPTPSPTGSSGSRSMSPAVPPQNHRPPYQHPNEQQQPIDPTAQQQRSPMIPNAQSANDFYDKRNIQGNYPTPPSPHKYPPPQATGPNAMPPQGMPPYGSQAQQFPQGNYPARPQYPANYGQVNGPANAPHVPNQNQYGRPMLNQTQFPQGNYPTPPSPHMHPAYKGGAVNGPAPNAAPVGTPRPLNHLKQHLLHKGGYGNQSPTSPQSFVNGPGMHQPMGPPQMQAPPRMQLPGSMGPPFSPHHNSQSGNTHQGVIPLPDSQDNGISSGSSASSQHPVTSIVTTGPDGTTIDEASQQSTISNASAASDPSDPQCSTPKRKTDAYNQGHMASAGSTPTMHDDFEMGSPTWSRTPASPVFSSNHSEPTPHRSSSKQKSDSLCKLYEMDDNPERRPFLDKLLSFMEERRTAITACPTISKQPLDLYRLYTSVKERGGFVEVCKVTKSKIWKDVAGLLGIGASSSAAYTLRKHYTKNLLPFECHYDRGGIDPAPLIQQVEAGSKKKTPKPASAPSPDANHKGSSNSQDSFQAAQIQSPPGSSSASMDSFNAYPPPPPQQQQQQQQPPPQQQQQQQQQQQSQQQQPQQQATGPSGPVPPTAYPPQPNAAGATATPQYPIEQQPYGPPTQQPPFQQPQQSQFNAPNRYPPYGDAPDARYNQHQGPPPPPAAQQSGTQASPAVQTPAGPLSNAPPSQYPQGPPPQQFDYRPQEPPQSRRHPDFAKESQYPQAPAQFNPRPQLYPNWQGNTSPGHYSRQYPQAPQQWGSQRLPGPPVMGGPQNAQWDQHRYPPQNSQPPYPGNQVQPPQWSAMNQTPMGSVPNAIRPPQRGQIPGKTMPGTMPPPQSAKPQVAPFPSASPAKRDIVFPSDSVEAVTPLLYRRKRLTKIDIGQTDMWRIFMCLQSGLLSESTWALDVLNILLFDDSSIQWFSLCHLPGLLNMLLDHFQKSLTDMFDASKYSGRPAKPQLKAEHKKSSSKENEVTEVYEDEDGLLKDSKDSVDLGQVTKQPNPNDRLVVLHSTTNYTMCSRKGIPVRIKEADDDIFVLDLKRSWDIHSNIDHQIDTNAGTDAWIYGHNEPEPFAHIIDSFKGEFVNIPFTRYIKSSDRKRKANESNDIKTALKSDNDDDSKKSSVNSPNASVTDEKVEECNEPKVVESVNSADADKAVAIDTKKEDIKSEPMEVDAIETTKNNDDSCKIRDSQLTKKELSPVMDSDCREVDMELEKISNGPYSNEAATTENEHNKSENTTNTKPTFDVKKTIQDPAETLKRRRIGDYEDECYARDEASLYLISENQDTMARRCLSISNILRNLTFVPGNETVFANSETFLAVLGRILLLHHKHPVRTQTIRNYDREDDNDFSDSCSSLQGENEWWWDYLIQLRENMMVAVANIAGHMQLANYEEIIARPCLDGLLHWAICPSAHGQDPFPTSGSNSVLSPQRLALEALCKICVTDANVDLVIATPPFSRLENLCSVLTRHLCRNEDQVLREFSVNLLHYLASAESSMARTVALQSPCISYLVAFIEQAEQTALGIANQHGINYLRENPDSMGTSLDMLRRTAGTLLHLARHPDNRPLFLQQEQRLLGLVMSHILDQQVALIISRVLFQVSRGSGSIESPVKTVKKRQLPHNNGKLATNTESSIPVS